MACHAETFDVARIYQPEGNGNATLLREPFVMLTGFMGTRLEDGSGTVVWGEFFTGQPSIRDPELQRLMALPVEDRPLSELHDEVAAIESMVTTRIGRK